MTPDEIIVSIGKDKYIDLLDLKPEDIDIKMIATSLGRLARWTGGGKGFYSVAEHSVVMSKFVPERVALACLLHDAHEAFTGDILTPFKRYLGGVVEEIQDNIDNVICSALGLEFSDALKAEVKHIDNRMILTEWSKVMQNAGPCEGYEHYEPVEFHPMYWPSEMGRDMFLHRFDALMPGYRE